MENNKTHLNSDNRILSSSASDSDCRILSSSASDSDCGILSSSVSCSDHVFLSRSFFKSAIRILLLTLIMIPLLGIFSGNNKTYAATLSNKSIYIWYQDSQTIRLKGASGTVKWSSSNKKVATVKKTSSNSATISGKSVGSATISAKCGGKTYKCKVHTWSISLSSGNGSCLPLGIKCKFTIKGAKFQSLSSSNKSIAVINSDGTIKGKKLGSCYIYYKVGGTKYRQSITVKKPWMELLGWHFKAGGTSTVKFSGNIEPDKTGSISLINSRAGVEQTFYFLFAGENVKSGLSISSSNPRVLTFSRMKSGFAMFNSYEDGKTTLTVTYQGYKYKYNITIQDSNSSYYAKKRQQIYTEAGIQSSMSDQYKCLLLARWICDNAIYDDINYNPDLNINNIAIGKDASYKDFMRSSYIVCSGYSDLYAYLCDGLGISCRQVRNSTMMHEWNQVEIDGYWYNVDTCWMDSAEDGYYDFEYFLVSDAKMKSMSKGEHLSDSSFKATSTRFDGCLDEQLTAQNDALGLYFSNIYYYYCQYSPWMTGTWKNY